MAVIRGFGFVRRGCVCWRRLQELGFLGIGGCAGAAGEQWYFDHGPHFSSARVVLWRDAHRALGVNARESRWDWYTVVLKFSASVATEDGKWHRLVLERLSELLRRTRYSVIRNEKICVVLARTRTVVRGSDGCDRAKI
jgi:hypothetical protein